MKKSALVEALQNFFVSLFVGEMCILLVSWCIFVFVPSVAKVGMASEAFFYLNIAMLCVVLLHTIYMFLARRFLSSLSPVVRRSLLFLLVLPAIYALTFWILWISGIFQYALEFYESELFHLDERWNYQSESIIIAVQYIVVGVSLAYWVLGVLLSEMWITKDEHKPLSFIGSPTHMGRSRKDILIQVLSLIYLAGSTGLYLTFLLNVQVWYSASAILFLAGGLGLVGFWLLLLGNMSGRGMRWIVLLLLWVGILSASITAIFLFLWVFAYYGSMLMVILPTWLLVLVVMAFYWMRKKIFKRKDS